MGDQLDDGVDAGSLHYRDQLIDGTFRVVNEGCGDDQGRPYANLDVHSTT
jgi:hypothetical protein